VLALCAVATANLDAQMPGSANPVLAENAVKRVSDHVYVIMGFPNVVFVDSPAGAGRRDAAARRRISRALPRHITSQQGPAAGRHTSPRRPPSTAKRNSISAASPFACSGWGRRSPRGDVIFVEPNSALLPGDIVMSKLVPNIPTPDASPKNETSSSGALRSE
jgi:hypothetical protein